MKRPDDSPKPRWIALTHVADNAYMIDASGGLGVMLGAPLPERTTLYLIDDTMDRTLAVVNLDATVALDEAFPESESGVGQILTYIHGNPSIYAGMEPELFRLWGSTGK